MQVRTKLQMTQMCWNFYLKIAARWCRIQDSWWQHKKTREKKRALAIKPCFSTFTIQFPNGNNFFMTLSWFFHLPLVSSSLGEFVHHFESFFRFQFSQLRSKLCLTFFYYSISILKWWSILIHKRQKELNIQFTRTPKNVFPIHSV